MIKEQQPENVSADYYLFLMPLPLFNKIVMFTGDDWESLTLVNKVLYRLINGTVTSIATNWDTTDNNLPALQNFQHLTSLDLRGKGVTCEGLMQFTKFTKLIKFQLFSEQYIEDILQYISKCINLQDLYLMDARVTDYALYSVTKFTDLTTCKLNSNYITDKALLYLAQCTKLTELDISGCYRITQNGLMHLTRLPKLEILDISYTAVKAESITFIEENLRIEDLRTSWQNDRN